jgi:hypothetical protein
MNNRNSNKALAGLPLLLLCMAMSGSALAQAELDTNRLPTPATRVYSCGQVDISWNLELINQYPRINEACHEVVTVDGTKYARFEANFVRVNADGTVTSDFVGPQGRTMGRYTLVPAPDQKVTLSGVEYPFSALKPRQQINLYVPEGATGLASSPTASPQQYARLSAYEEVAPEQQEQPQPQYVAQADPPPAMANERLPDTAGPLPWFALSGVIALLGGLGLSLGRRQG